MNFALLFNNPIQKPATDDNLSRIALVYFSQATKNVRFIVGSSGTGPKARIIVIDPSEMKKLINGKTEEQILEFLNQKTKKTFVAGRKPGIYIAQ